MEPTQKLRWTKDVWSHKVCRLSAAGNLQVSGQSQHGIGESSKLKLITSRRGVALFLTSELDWTFEPCLELGASTRSEFGSIEALVDFFRS